MSSSKNSPTTVEDRLAHIMIKHMGDHGYNMLNVLRTIGAPTAEGLLGVILKQETLAEEHIKQLEEEKEGLVKELGDLQDDSDDAIHEKFHEIADLDDKVLKLQEENKKLQEKNKKLEEDMKTKCDQLKTSK